jgi:hypothetical protein
MKLRAGFVSNSSSSSYIIAYDESRFVKCECCGFTPTTPIARFRGFGESTLRWDDADDRLEELRKNSRVVLDEIGVLCKQDPRKIIDGYVGYTQTVNDRLVSLQDELDMIHRELADIKCYVDKGQVVIGVDVDYHDSDEEYLSEMATQGFITIIQGD